VYGSLPTESQLAEWNFAISQHSAVPQGVLVRFLFLSISGNP
jgi:citrate synthase